MTINIKPVSDELEKMAADLELSGDYSDHVHKNKTITHVIMFETTRLTLKMVNHPDEIRERAKRLRRMTRESNAVCSSVNAPRLPSMKRPAFSQHLADQFLLDGERDNYYNYMALYARS